MSIEQAINPEDCLHCQLGRKDPESWKTCYYQCVYGTNQRRNLLVQQELEINKYKGILAKIDKWCREACNTCDNLLDEECVTCNDCPLDHIVQPILSMIADANNPNKVDLKPDSGMLFNKEQIESVIESDGYVYTRKAYEDLDEKHVTLIQEYEELKRKEPTNPRLVETLYITAKQFYKEQLSSLEEFGLDVDRIMGEYDNE